MNIASESNNFYKNVQIYQKSLFGRIVPAILLWKFPENINKEVSIYFNKIHTLLIIFKDHLLYNINFG